MSKFHDGKNGQMYFLCPGCTAHSGYPEVHSVSVDPARARKMSDGSRPCWKFNGDRQKPTLTPSVNYPGLCHFTIREGRIHYLGDSAHVFANVSMELPDWKDPAEK